jgi:hypothetical protein
MAEIVSASWALDRIDDIGSAFANDLNDGDSIVNYENLYTYEDDYGNIILTYHASLEDGRDVEFEWRLERLK